MRVASLWQPVGIGLLAAVLATGAARAEDQIRAGKWEFHVQVAGVNIPKLPPGVQLPPGIQMGAGGVSVTRTSCITSNNPIPPDNRMAKTGDRDNQCKIAKMDRHGGSVSWIIDCQSPHGAMHSEGEAHYYGDSMEATFKSRTSPNGAPTETSQHITGRYLGPYDK